MDVTFVSVVLFTQEFDTRESDFVVDETRVESGFCRFVDHTWSPDFVVLWTTHGVRILLFCGPHMESGFYRFVEDT